jgi:hypothetical protein
MYKENTLLLYLRAADIRYRYSASDIMPKRSSFWLVLDSIPFSISILEERCVVEDSIADQVSAMSFHHDVLQARDNKKKKGPILKKCAREN